MFINNRMRLKSTKKRIIITYIYWYNLRTRERERERETDRQTDRQGERVRPCVVEKEKLKLYNLH